MRAGEARELAGRVLTKLSEGGHGDAYDLLRPLLSERTPFSTLDRIGEVIGRGSLAEIDPFLLHVVAEGTMGGWVVAGKCLGEQVDRDLKGALSRGRGLMAQGARWYVTDIIGERVPGPALVRQFDSAVVELESWSLDRDPWVRRGLGVAVHYWAKWARGDPTRMLRAKTLLDVVEPLFSEQSMDALKGIGWGLKTLGRFYPDLVASWLSQQVVVRKRRYRALMVRKAITYLSPAHRARALGESSP